MEKKITKEIRKKVAECMSELVWLRTDGSIAHVAIIAKGM